MKLDPEKKTMVPTTRSRKGGKRTSNMFATTEQLEITDEKILAACPEEIPSSFISLNGSTDNARRAQIAKYKAKGKKYKWWTEDDRIRAATVYAMTGNAKRVEEITAIPSTTIRQWKMTEWWPQVIDRIRKESDDELDVKLTGLIDKTTKEINDRLDKGDYIYNNKTGELTRKPLGGKEMAVMTSIFVDKRSLLRKKPKIATDQGSVDERLKKLAEEFGKFVKAKTVSGEVVNKETEETPQAA